MKQQFILLQIFREAHFGTGAEEKCKTVLQKNPNLGKLRENIAVFTPSPIQSCDIFSLMRAKDLNSDNITTQKHANVVVCTIDLIQLLHSTILRFFATI